MNGSIQIRGKTTANWSGQSLLARQLGLDLDLGELRVRADDGDFGSAWRIGLPYTNSMPGSPTNNQALTAAGIKTYVLSALASGVAKGYADVATTTNIDLSSMPSSVDGITLVNGMRVLVKDQSTASQNGVYTFISPGSAAVRTNDFATFDVIAVTNVSVDQGTQAGTVWYCSATTGGTLGTDSLPYMQISAGATYTADEDTLQLVSGEFSIKDVELLALASLISAPNKLPYFTGSGTASLADLTAFARSILDDADAATVLGTLGANTVGQAILQLANPSAIRYLRINADNTASLVNGSTLRSDINAQGLDDELTALAGLTSAANKVPRFTGSGTADLLDFDTDGTLAANSATRIPSQSAVKAYVDSLVNGVDWKEHVRVATTANITLSGTQTIDGVSVGAGERVLVKNQTAPAENGIWVCAAGAWGRATDADSGLDLELAIVKVQEGTANALKEYRCSSYSITLGTTAITWLEWSAGTTYAGDELGIHLSAGVFSLINGGVTLANLANIADQTILGNNTGGSAAPVALTAAQVRTLLALVIGTNVQAYDADLDAIAGLSASNDDVIQRKSGAWANRTLAQLVTDLAAQGVARGPVPVTLGTQFDTSSASYVDVTGLAITLPDPGTYLLQIVAPFSSPNASTGVSISMTVTGSPTIRSFLRTQPATASTAITDVINVDDAGTIPTTIGGINTPRPATIHGIVKTNGSNAVVQMRVCRGGTSNTVSVLVGASIAAVKVA